MARGVMPHPFLVLQHLFFCAVPSPLMLAEAAGPLRATAWQSTSCWGVECGAPPGSPALSGRSCTTELVQEQDLLDLLGVEVAGLGLQVLQAVQKDTDNQVEGGDEAAAGTSHFPFSMTTAAFDKVFPPCFQDQISFL
ncbi:hypothetical protein NDU88_000346 [Pleurodeles waltl]|uniref:Uncharacterized protein n=1 Tax=Pleurodeles waltl TaxID=8319 RepID=A0AAV7L9W8_PLEWA|nr:hypothetical protein NDU88_000346 [Pleurodeles waltl]